MPEHDFDKEIDMLVTLGVSEEIRNEYISSMQLYDKAVKDALQPDIHGLPHRLTPQEYEDLYQSYVRAMAAAATLNRELGEEQSPDFVKKDVRYFNANFAVMRAVTEKKEDTSLINAMENQRNLVLEGELSTHTMGDAMSSRLVVNAMDKHGKIRTGLFTEEKRMTQAQVDHPTTNQEKMNVNWLNLEAEDRIDTRNAAMSDVAGLLGRSDLIAEAQEVRYDSNGTTKTGTFMEFVEGTDLAHLSADPRERYYQVDPKDAFTANLKKDALDLTIIDYICFNIDRHGHNMLYKYKRCDDGKVRLNGLVGIDNDASFRNKLVDPSIKFDRLQALDDTVVISESMAEKVMKLTPDQLTSVLKHDKLSDTAIDFACKRLAEVQRRIQNGQEFSERFRTGELGEEERKFLKSPVVMMRTMRGKDKNLPAMMVVVPDRHMEKVDIVRLGAAASEAPGPGPLAGVCGQVSEMHTAKRIRQVQKEAQENFARLQVQAPEVKLKIEDVSSFCRGIAPRMSEFAGKFTNTATDPALQEIGQITAQLARKTEQLGRQGTVPTERQMNFLSMKFKALQTSCRNYITKAKAEADARGKKISGKEAMDLQLVKNIGKGTMNYQDTIRKLRDNTINAVRERAGKEAESLSERIRSGNLRPDEVPGEKVFVEKDQVLLDKNALFGGTFSNDKSVRNWIGDVEKKGGSTNRAAWQEEVFRFDFSHYFDATPADAKALTTGFKDLYQSYQKLTSGETVDARAWLTEVAPKAEELRNRLDKFNKDTDFIYLNDPKMHAMSRILTGLENTSEKLRDTVQAKDHPEVSITAVTISEAPYVNVSVENGILQVYYPETANSYYCAPDTNGIPLLSGQTMDVAMEKWNGTDNLEPQSLGNYYLVVVETDSMSLAGTENELSASFTYKTLAGLTTTTKTYSLHALVGNYYGYFLDAEGKDSDCAYYTAVMSGGMMYFVLDIPNLYSFTSVTFTMAGESASEEIVEELSEDNMAGEIEAETERGDEWQMKAITIYELEELGKREVLLGTGVKLESFSTNRTYYRNNYYGERGAINSAEGPLMIAPGGSKTIDLESGAVSGEAYGKEGTRGGNQEGKCKSGTNGISKTYKRPLDRNCNKERESSCRIRKKKKL